MFSAILEIDFYHYLSCLQWTPRYQEKVTNWYFSLYFLANSLFYNYNQFSSSLMVTYHLGLDFFVSSSINILYPFFDQCRILNIFYDRSKVLQKNRIFTSVQSYISVVCMLYAYCYEYAMVWRYLLWRKVICFKHDIICIQFINQISLQYQII